MPRHIDLEAERKDLDAQKQSGGRKLRQFVFKLEPQDAIRLIDDCIEAEEQPGPHLAKIVTNYLDEVNRGVYLHLPPGLRAVVTEIARMRQTDRNGTIVAILEEVADSIMQREVARQRSRAAAVIEAQTTEAPKSGGKK